MIRQLRRSAAAAQLLAAHPSLLRRREHLFLLSHVRGYTTLISHIIGSHPEVSGYAETWGRYRSTLDLLRLRVFVCRHGNYKPGSKYLFDKLLHDRLTISDAILGRDDVHCVFMLRRPAATLKSMVALYRKYIAEGGSPVGCTLPDSVETALLAYQTRLATLKEFGDRLRRLEREYVVIAADELIENSTAVLDKISAFLRLETPLCQEYSSFSRTGSWDQGDTSEFIHHGKIVRQRPQHEEIEVPDEITERATRTYEQCLTHLRRAALLALHVAVIYVTDALDFVAGAFVLS